MIGEQSLRIASLLVWSIAFLAFLPAAISALHGEHSALAIVSLAACFSFANRLVFSVTQLFAPDLVIIAHAQSVIAGAWFAYVGFKVVWHGR